MTNVLPDGLKNDLGIWYLHARAMKARGIEKLNPFDLMIPSLSGLSTSCQASVRFKCACVIAMRSAIVRYRTCNEPVSSDRFSIHPNVAFSHGCHIERDGFLPFRRIHGHLKYRMIKISPNTCLDMKQYGKWRCMNGRIIDNIKKNGLEYLVPNQRLIFRWF